MEFTIQIRQNFRNVFEILVTSSRSKFSIQTSLINLNHHNNDYDSCKCNLIYKEYTIYNSQKNRIYGKVFQLLNNNAFFNII